MGKYCCRRVQEMTVLCLLIRKDGSSSQFPAVSTMKRQTSPPPRKMSLKWRSFKKLPCIYMEKLTSNLMCFSLCVKSRSLGRQCLQTNVAHTVLPPFATWQKAGSKGLFRNKALSGTAGKGNVDRSTHDCHILPPSLPFVTEFIRKTLKQATGTCHNI